MSRTLKFAVVTCVALALQGCGIFGGKKPPPPLGAETEQEQKGPDASEQPVVNPEVTRRKIKLAKIDSQDFELGAYFGLLSIEDFGSSSVLGLRGDYHITESFFLEGTIGSSKGGTTSYERLAGGPQLLTASERNYNFGALNIGWDALPGEIFVSKGTAYNTAFYLTAGLGITRFAKDDRFTANVGMGYRILFLRFMSAHFDMRDYMFDIDLLGEKKVAHNLEGSLGLSFYF